EPSVCLALIARDAHPAYAVVIAANRDEHHARAAAPAAWWPQGWIAGRDLVAGGTWLAVTRTGRFAFVTNVREPGLRDLNAPTRGTLVTRLVADSQAPAKSATDIVGSAAAYKGVNLIAGDLFSDCLGSNR